MITASTKEDHMNYLVVLAIVTVAIGSVLATMYSSVLIALIGLFSSLIMLIVDIHNQLIG